MTTTTTSVRAVIDSNRAILVRNIILCPEFYDNIARLNVFPDSMLKDIKVRSTAMSVRKSFTYDRGCSVVSVHCNFGKPFARSIIISCEMGRILMLFI